MSISLLKANAQNATIDSLLNSYEFTMAKKYLKSLALKDKNEENLYYSQIYSSEKIVDSSFYFLFNIDTLSFDTSQKARYYNYLATTYDSNNEEDIAFNLYRRAQKYYTQTNDVKTANKINLELYATLNAQEYYNYTKDDYLTIFKKNAIENKFYGQLTDFYLEKAFKHFTLEGRDSVNYYLNKAFFYNGQDGNKLTKARIHGYKGLYLAEVISELDSADYHYNQALKIEKEMDISYRIFYTYINQASVLRKRNKPLAVISLLLKADSIPQTLYRKNNLKFLYSLLSNDYETIGEYSEALNYLKKHIAYRDSTNIVAQNVNLTKYQTAEKEKQLLISTQKQQQNQNIAIGLGGGLLGVALIGFLLFKNTKRKQRIAEQEREIEIQKTEKLLKEQELTTIDAMISGQEKERQRLAGDLHDSVGATLAAAKLQFTHLQTHKDKLDTLDELFSTTGGLLDQAYQEIRTMAHLKNSGVIAKNGLLPAVEKLAKNASSANGLQITVQDFGLDDRLENSLEITVFRVIQELVTNIIKHAQASEASVSITQHERALNIIVEDNGKGFDTRKTTEANGMGLSSIERRIEHLEGTMEVDTTMDKGTTILIDIPL